MTSGPPDARRPDGHDPSIVPGLGGPVPAPRADARGSRPGGPLDMSQDPDRFDPDHVGTGRPAGPTGPLDMSQDPDRYDAGRDGSDASVTVFGPLGRTRDPDRRPRAGEGQSLTDLVGKDRAHEDDRDNYTWALGLLGVLAFLAVVAFLFGEVLSP